MMERKIIVRLGCLELNNLLSEKRMPACGVEKNTQSKRFQEK